MSAPNPLRHLSNIRYRASNGTDFVFDFELRSSDGWRIHIKRQPGYRNRPTSAEATHRLGTRERPYICWDSPIRSLRDAYGITALWSECTLVYISTGVFRPPDPMPPIRDDTGIP